MPRTRPPYPPEFRREAVRMVRSSGRPISEAARELGVSAESLRKWVKQTEVDAATREEIASIRAESGGDGGGELSAPLGRLKSGRLVFANGTLRLNLRAAGMADLYRASFEGPAPKVEAEDGTVTVRYSWGFRALKWRGHSGEVTLNAAVPWEVEMRGGASEIEADLGG
ncbi:MAG: transposase, partial [Actinomycetota bacterium]|nr:transposase [Actinomycetota bacterium]